MSKLYVGNLPYRVTQEEIKTLFSAHGEVKHVKLISDTHTGRAKGFGFVEMESKEQAQKAASALNGQEFQGRPLRIDEAREDKKRRQ